VPHFGEEEDIITTKEHIAAAEKEAKHESKQLLLHQKDIQ